MNFGTVLSRAQKNEKNTKHQDVRCYSTKFEPPKKEQRNKQQLSENIKKFLAKKEAEERAKKLEEQRKREELMALRAKDKKATRRVNCMLKRTKSANQSVLQDAVDRNNTSVTLAGPMQPDEDDYGYVSQEAAAQYNKMMEKYSKMPDEPKFSLKKKKVSMDLNSTKERVKAAIEREKEEALLPHKRKRKHGGDEKLREDVGRDNRDETRAPPVKKPRPAAPPPINFNDLLKLAEKKQFEPVVIEQKPKEEEKLYTKKQKKELEREKESRDRRDGKLPPLQPVEQKPQKGPSIVQPPKAQPDKTPIKIEMKRPPKVVVPNPSSKKVMDSKSSMSSQQKVPLSNKPNVTLPRKDKDLDRRKVLLTKKKMPVTGKEFPPRDLNIKTKKPAKLMVNKGRLMDDDDDEYDSEMDDFIDDDDAQEDYSKYISEIFGYDKRKYQQFDDDDDNMESTFAQQMREEVISTKIGIMEDLEDMKIEEEHKRRKVLMKKKCK